MTPRTPQVGDTITTAEELDALPREAVARTSTGWILITPVNSRVPFLGPDYPMTILYLPGQPPRPEREVKAEALREAADGVIGATSIPLADAHRAACWLLAEADRIERGDA